MAVTADNTVFMEMKQLLEDGYAVDLEVAASTVIYKDSFVGLSATGYLTSYVAPASGAAIVGTKFVGIALEHIASQTSDGDKRCRVQIEGYFRYTLTGATRIDVGTPVFASDNSTLVMAGSSGNCVGYIVGPAGTNEALVKLVGVHAQFAGHFFSVVSAALDMAVVDQKILLVHETQNPGGLYLVNCVGLLTENTMAANTLGVVTIQHTATTSVGCTLTAIDNDVAGEVIVGVGGQLCGAKAAAGTSYTASGDAMVVIPAGTQCNAQTTTRNFEAAAETGQIKIFATFLCL